MKIILLFDKIKINRWWSNREICLSVYCTFCLTMILLFCKRINFSVANSDALLGREVDEEKAIE